MGPPVITYKLSSKFEAVLVCRPRWLHGFLWILSESRLGIHNDAHDFPFTSLGLATSLTPQILGNDSLTYTFYLWCSPMLA